MNAFTTICGWIFILLVGISLTALVVGMMADVCRTVLERFERAVIARTRHDLGIDIQSCAHWFSESPETWVAIKILGDRLTRGYATDVNRWREEWRKASEDIRTGDASKHGERASSKVER